MFCYRDMTFCTRDCWNMECKRNAKKVDLENLDTDLPVCVDEFKNCKDWRGEDEDNDKSTNVR